MKKVCAPLLLLIFMSFGTSLWAESKIYTFGKQYPSSLQQLHKNVLDNILTDFPNAKETENLLGSLLENGSWADVDYTSKERGGWPTANHIYRILDLARAYRSPQSSIFENKKASAKIHKALNYWFDSDFQCPNWWYPEIGVPMSLAPAMILMEDELSQTEKEKGVKILDRAKIGMTGQNKVWLSGNVLLKSLLLRDEETISKAAQSIQEELVVSTGEGVQPDWSYHQHGPQLQFGNYGLAYVGDMIKWIAILRQTPFQFDESKIFVLRNYLLEGQQWVSWRNYYDISSCGRQLFPNAQRSKASSLAQDLSLMETLDPQYAPDYKKANNYQTLTGNRHFWRSDIQVQRSPEYYFSVKMCSERVIGAESCNSENIQGYYMGDGATFLYQTQKEYEDIFPYWDWKKIPGTTVQQNNEALPVLTARGYRITSDFVGGVSDGINGIAAMNYVRNGLSAHKAWFMFDDKIVCLGAGISAEENLPVVTSVNQSFLHGPIHSDTGKSGLEKMSGKLKLNWLIHDQIGYFFPGVSEVNLHTGEVEGSWNWVASRYPNMTTKANLFHLWMEHGTNPQGASYAYILVPHASSDLLESMKKKPVFAIKNEPEMQEVLSTDGTIGGIVFYKARGSAAFGGISVDQACVVMVKKTGKGLVLSVADPTQKLQSLKLTFGKRFSTENDANTNELKIELPANEMAGKSVIVDLILN